MELLSALGVNQTVAIQFIIFVVVYFVLNKVLFTPYIAALEERRSRTEGQSEKAEQFMEEAKALHDQYAVKVREMNAQQKDIYDQARGEAMKRYEQIVVGAREKSKNTIEEAQKTLKADLQKIRQQAEQEIPAITSLITERLIGKEHS